MLNWAKRHAVVLLVIVLAILIWPHFNNSKPRTNPVVTPKCFIGKGIWIWNISACEGGNVDKIVEKAKWARLDHVLIKTHDGQKWTGELRHRYNRRKQVLSLLDALHKAGIKVYAWGYCYGNDPKVESSKAIASLKLGFDGYVFDVEREFAYKHRSAELLCYPVWKFRQRHCPEKLLGYSTFSRVNRQQALPYDVFGRYCDVAMPQAYWETFDQEPGFTAYQMCQVWGKMEDDWRNSDREKSIKPIIPTGHAEAGIATAEVARFMNAVKGYYGVNFWVWDYIPQRSWESIRNGPVGQVRPKTTKVTTPLRYHLKTILVTVFRLWFSLAVFFFLFCATLLLCRRDKRIGQSEYQLTLLIRCLAWPWIVYHVVRESLTHR